MESLWPKLEKLAVNVPIRILQDQVDLFNEQMKGMLSCTLEREEIVNYNYDCEASMYISSPALPDYRLQLVEVKFSVAKAYPCEVHNCVNDRYPITGQKANSADEFKEILKEIFNSQEVINALQNILAQGI